MGEKSHEHLKQEQLQLQFDHNDEKDSTLEDYNTHIVREVNRHYANKKPITMVIYGKPHYYAKESLFILNQDNKLRTKIAEIQNNKYFKWFIRLMLIMNLLPFVLYDYSLRIYP
jgi:hypothetical protein